MINVRLKELIVKKTETLYEISPQPSALTVLANDDPSPTTSSDKSPPDMTYDILKIFVCLIIFYNLNASYNFKKFVCIINFCLRCLALEFGVHGINM